MPLLRTSPSCSTAPRDSRSEQDRARRMSLETGRRLGPYEVVALIGAGGMGEVYRARDTKLGREVALKVLARSVTGDPKYFRRFEEEARLASVLNHPNIVTIY